jgi:hypothetical protein
LWYNIKNLAFVTFYIIFISFFISGPISNFRSINLKLECSWRLFLCQFVSIIGKKIISDNWLFECIELRLFINKIGKWYDMIVYKKQDWKFFHSLSREKKMSKLSKILFFAILDMQCLTCNSWMEILDKREQDTMCHGKAQNVPQDGTTRLLNLCATGRHKKTFKTYVPREGTKCAVARHKRLLRLMCHGKAQNVP